MQDHARHQVDSRPCAGRVVDGRATRGKASWNLDGNRHTGIERSSCFDVGGGHPAYGTGRPPGPFSCGRVERALEPECGNQNDRRPSEESSQPIAASKAADDRDENGGGAERRRKRGAVDRGHGEIQSWTDDGEVAGVERAQSLDEELEDELSLDDELLLEELEDDVSLEEELSLDALEDDDEDP